MVYDSATYGSDDIIIDGATAVLKINSGSLSLSNLFDFRNGATLDNSGTISSGDNINGVSSASGNKLINENGGQIKSANYVGVVFFNGGTAANTKPAARSTAPSTASTSRALPEPSPTPVARAGPRAAVSASSCSPAATSTNAGAGSYIQNGVSVLGTSWLEDEQCKASAEIDGGVHLKASATVTNRRHR